MINETEIIDMLAGYSAGYIGDDAAVFPATTDGQWVVSKDLLIEEIHFQVDRFTPEDLAHKALQVNLSDCAAMGAKPCFILCGTSIPKRLEKYAVFFLRNLAALCQKEGVVLVGGDTTGSKKSLSISITVIGVGDNPLYRSTAGGSEYICLAGNLGYSYLGMLDQSFEPYFLRPTARVNEGSWLSKQGTVSSMMDVSDGLVVDLKRLCEASSVLGVLELDGFSYSDPYLVACKHLRLDPCKIALSGGEDYGLLFTAKKNEYSALAKQFKKRFGYSLKNLGYTEQGAGVLFAKNGEAIQLDLNLFSHFGESDAY